MRLHLASAVAASSVLLLGTASPDQPREAAAKVPAPVARRAPVADTYHGVKVVDPYRWLETGEDPKVVSWSEKENAHARAFLDAMPGVAALRDEVKQVVSARPASIGGVRWVNGKLFAVRHDPATKQQPWIVSLASLTSTDGMRTLVDPNAIDPSGGTAFDWFVISADASKIAVSLSKGGSEAGTLRVYDVASGKETGDVIPRVQVGTGGGSCAFTADGTGLYYTRYPHEGERPKEDLDFWQQVFFHRLGTPVSEDRVSLTDLPRIAETVLHASADGKRLLAVIENGDGGDYAVYFLPEGETTWKRVGDFADGLIDARFGRDGAIWALSKKGAPRRRVLSIRAETPTLAAAKIVLDQREGVIDAFTLTDTRLFAIEARGGTSRIRSYTLEGRLVEELPTPPVSDVAALQPLEGDKVLFGASSFLAPFAGEVYDPTAKSVTPTIVKQTPLTDFSDAEVVEESATSKDGTRVPMFILQRKGTKRDGKNPVILTGYGGFGISQTPYFSDLNHLFVERGVVFVSAVLRGGGEFGEEWHDAGRLTKKQNVFDDFLACARRLVALGYTTHSRLAIHGGSNGGLLMGAAFTQAPQLFRAVVSDVGIYDMLRVESSANGQFNVTEYGSVKDEAQFQALHAYSPYHHVKPGTRYPAILMTTGANDPRVDPMQSRKMIARLSAADPTGSFLLRTSSGMGHGGIGAGVDAVVSLIADTEGFLFHELGVPLEKPKSLDQPPLR